MLLVCCWDPQTRKEKAPGLTGIRWDLGAFRQSGRLDLNQRPLAPQARADDQPPEVASCNPSQSDVEPSSAMPMRSLKFAGFRSRVNAPVMQEVGAGSPCPRLLTVKEAAARLRVSTATVYALCGRGELTHVRIATHAIRIAERDVAAFIEGRGIRRT